MSRNVLPAAGFTGAVPGHLKCGFCKQPVQGEFYRALGRFSCAACAGKLQAAVARNVVTPANFIAAAGTGLLVSAGCAAVWAAIVHATNYELGIVASLIGVAVGKAVHIASGRRRGSALQWLAAVLSVVGVIGGKLMLLGWGIADVLNKKGIAVTAATMTRVMKFMIKEDFSSIFGGFDLLWIGIAVYAAWRLCKAPRITIAGPFPVARSGGTGLQFEMIEPADSRAASEGP